MNYSDNLVKTLNNLANEYRGKLQDSVTKVLNEARYKNTGRGVSSVTVVVVPGTKEKSPSLVIKMDDHVLLLDRSKMQWTKLPDMNNLLEWAKTKKTDPLEIKKMAWAIAVDKRKNDTWKPKKWRKKGLGTVLKEMNAEMLAEFDSAIDKDLQEAVDNQYS